MANVDMIDLPPLRTNAKHITLLTNSNYTENLGARYCLDLGLGLFSSHWILNWKTEACEIAWYVLFTSQEVDPAKVIKAIQEILPPPT